MTNYLIFGDNMSVYSELPVDIETFICDDYFLGKFTKNGKMIYPYWRDKLNKMFIQDSNYSEMVNATAIGTGKTIISVICFIYYLYCLMCLKNPNDFFKACEEDEIEILLASVKKLYALQYYSMLINAIFDSPWFKNHGIFMCKNTKKNSNDINSKIIYQPFNKIKIEIAYSKDMIYGKHIVGFWFGWLYDATDTKEFYQELKSRVESRTIIDSVKYGRSFVDFEFNCKRYVLDYWKSCYNDIMLNTGPQWEVRPSNCYDSTRFIIITDGIKGHSKILEKSSNEDRIIPKCYRIIEIPGNLLYDAKLDIDGFLVNIAGIDIKDETE